MKTVRILTARDAADLIHDGDIVTVSSSSGLGCPDAVLAGLGERFQQTGTPRGLTSVHPIAAGDMYGIAGIDHIAHAGLLDTVIAGSYPSGPSRAEPPLIWKRIEADEIHAYNFPSGVVFQMHRAAAAGQPGVFTHVGQDTFVDPRQQGGRMNDSTPEGLVEVVEVGGEEWLFYRAVKPDVAIIRATTADEHGNLTFEDEGSPLGALDQAYAAHNNGGVVIAQVKRVGVGGSLNPQQVRVPGILVDAIVVAPDQLQTTQTKNDPAISGQLRRPLSELPPVPHGLEKVTARRATLELHRGDIVNLGFGISALVPHILVEEGEPDAVSWVIEQGAVGGVPLQGFAFGCSQNPDAIVQSADQFTLLQGAGFDRTLLSFLEVDAEGNVNVHYLPGKRHVTSGVGGFADITSNARDIVFLGSFTAGHRNIALTGSGIEIREDGPHTKFVPRVAQVTFSGRRALDRGARVRYVTERCVLELTEHGLEVTEIAPGVDVERDVLARSGIKLSVSPTLRTTDEALYTMGPFGLALSDRPEADRRRQLVQA